MHNRDSKISSTSRSYSSWFKTGSIFAVGTLGFLGLKWSGALSLLGAWLNDAKSQPKRVASERSKSILSLDKAIYKDNWFSSDIEAEALLSTAPSGNHAPVLNSSVEMSSDGLVAYYPFNGNANDESGNGNHGTVCGAILTENRFGNADQAYSFNGTNGIIVNTNPAFDLRNDFTFSFWLNPVSGSIFGRHIYARDNDGSWCFFIDPKIVFYDFQGSHLSVRSNAACPLNQWSHIAFTYDSNINVWNMYFGDKLDSTGIVDFTFNSLHPTNLNLYIGFQQGDPYTTCSLKGKLDDIRIYNRSLSSAEIQELYSAVATSLILTSIAEDTTSPVGDALANIIPEGLITDVDGISEKAIAITTVDDSNGSWQYSANNGINWTKIEPVNETNSLLLDSVNVIRFLPNADFSGRATFTFRAWDKTSGMAGMKVDTSINGGSTAFSSESTSASIIVSAVNDAPVLNQGGTLLDGLVAYYPFNSNANDESGNGNHGSVYGAILTADRFGISNMAYSFDGSSYIKIGEPVPISLQIQQSMTLSAWIYVTDYPYPYGFADGLGLIVGCQYDGSHSGATIFFDSRINPDGQIAPKGHIHFQIGDGSWHVTNANSVVPMNQWIHIAATRNANEVGKIYYNGITQPITSISWSGNILYNGSMYAIGKQKDQGDRYFIGMIDDIRIYNRSLSSTEIVALYSDSTALTLTPITEGTANPTGDTVANIIPDDLITDFDGPAVKAIAITTADNSNGQWQYSTNNGASWLEIAPVSNTNSLLLDSVNMLRFVPNANFNGNAAFTFRAWDKTSGVVGTKVDTSINGGTTAFSSTTSAASITVMPRKDSFNTALIFGLVGGGVALVLTGIGIFAHKRCSKCHKDNKILPAAETKYSGEQQGETEIRHDLSTQALEAGAVKVRIVPNAPLLAIEPGEEIPTVQTEQPGERDNDKSAAKIT